VTPGPAVSAATSASASPGVHTEVELLQATVSSLSQALREMNDELREKTMECDALQDTVATISQALSESEMHVDDLVLRCEQLDLKLQAVTFCDKREKVVKYINMAKLKKSRGTNSTDEGKKPYEVFGAEVVEASETFTDSFDDAEDDDDDGELLRPRPMARSRRKSDGGSSTNSSRKKRSTPSASSKHRRHSDSSVGSRGSSSSGQNSSDYNGDDSDGRDDSADENTQVSRRGGKGPGGSQQEQPPPQLLQPQAQPQPVDPSSPNHRTTLTPAGQAAFYSVILERDQARRQADRLQQEVNQKRELVRKLKAKLNKSTALIELSYNLPKPEQGQLDEEEQPRQQYPSQLQAQLSSKQQKESKDHGHGSNGVGASPIKWLAKVGHHGKSAKVADHNAAEEGFHVKKGSLFGSKDEATSKHGQRSTEPLDADRAAGGVGGGSNQHHRHHHHHHHHTSAGTLHVEHLPIHKIPLPSEPFSRKRLEL